MMSIYLMNTFHSLPLSLFISPTIFYSLFYLFSLPYICFSFYTHFLPLLSLSGHDLKLFSLSLSHSTKKIRSNEISSSPDCHSFCFFISVSVSSFLFLFVFVFVFCLCLCFCLCLFSFFTVRFNKYVYLIIFNLTET